MNEHNRTALPLIQVCQFYLVIDGQFDRLNNNTIPSIVTTLVLLVNDKCAVTQYHLRISVNTLIQVDYQHHSYIIQAYK